MALFPPKTEFRREGQLHIASLGSSFAAGPSIDPIIDSEAARSSNNYAHIVASRLNARLTDLSVSGATLQNVLSEPQTTRSGKTFEPQLSQLPTDVDIVTLTAGGNDLGYISNALYDIAGNYPGGRWLSSFVIPKSVPNLMTAEELAERFTEVVDRVKEIAPGVKRILLVEYLTLFGDDVKAGVDISLNKKEIQRHRDVAAILKRAYEISGERRDICEVVGIADASRGHGIGSDDPWVTGFSLGVLARGIVPLHPNRAGMEAVTGILEDIL